MCGRYAVTRSARELADELGATIAAGTEAWSPHYGVAPGQESPVLVEVPDRRLGLARFGLSTDAGHIVFNARAETLAERRLFAEAASRRRCLVPVDGFFEWEARGERKVPYFVHADRTMGPTGPLLLAAVFDVTHDRELDVASAPIRASKHTRFAIVTVPARSPVARIHDRMPLVVPRGLADSWLLRGELSIEDALAAIAAATPVPLAMHPVSRAIGRAANDDPHVLDPVDPDHEATGLLDFGDDLDERAG